MRLFSNLILVLLILNSCGVNGNNEDLSENEDRDPFSLFIFSGDEELSVSITPPQPQIVSVSKTLLYRKQGGLFYSGTQYQMVVNYTDGMYSRSIRILVFINSINVLEGKYQIDGYVPEQYWITSGYNISSIEYPTDGKMKLYYANNGEFEVKKRQDGGESIKLNIDYGLLTDNIFSDRVLNLQANFDLSGNKGAL